MFKFSFFLSLLALGSARKCKELIVPVSLVAENIVLDVQVPTTSIDVTNLFLQISQQGRDYTSIVSRGTKKIKGDYELAATYCEPEKGPGSELQIMTHGVGFDRKYWDHFYNGFNYSYVARAVDEHGYSTLTWDRLGIGASSKGHPINEIQVALEIEALRKLTSLAKKGKLPGVDTKFDKVIQLGHSFGSVMAHALSAMYPDLADTIVLTGFSHVFNFMPTFMVANNFIPIKNSPSLAALYPKGYVASASETSMQINFFGEGDFDPGMLTMSHLLGQPAAPGELLTVGVPAVKKSKFKGSVLVITGERDLPFCGQNCYATDVTGEDVHSLLDVSKKYYPNASRFNTTVVPGAGHALNYGYSHTFTFEKIFDFLSER
ncbi:Alpha/Beta hydrolase protein [Mariannaea sp. PMI_226]|nr:Alpha/Beta hydrolase protein [Mariannaea sp. PMI_226]